MHPPTVDRFRRLARSSPWLWSTLEFRWRFDSEALHHAWIQRPGNLRVEDADGQVIQVDAADRPFPGAKVSYNGGKMMPMPGRWPSQVEPHYGDDGLVAAVPVDHDIDYDSPFFQNYLWVAMLNPLELAESVHGIGESSVSVELRDLTIVEHHGRPAWQALAQPTTSYDPRCDCCALLSGAFDDERDEWAPGPPSRVRIDEQTGVCVHVECDGTEILDSEIIAVDRPVDSSLFTRRQRWLR